MTQHHPPSVDDQNDQKKSFHRCDIRLQDDKSRWFTSKIYKRRNSMMAEPVKEPKVRIQLDLTPKQAERFDNLIHYCDLGSRKELFNVAMSLFYWATQEASKGRKIASYDEGTDHVETIVVPALDSVAVHVANDSAKVSSPAATDFGSRKTDRPHFGLVGQGGGTLATSSD